MTAATGPVRDEERAAIRAEVDRETIEEARAFPTYEVPDFVLVRFPGFDPADPETWPEPDRCTDGRPWGHSSYASSGVLGSNVEYRWREYLRAVDLAASATRPPRTRPRSLGCRNRWKHEDSRLCGVHDAPWRDAIIRARKAEQRRQRIEEHLDLASRLDRYGIEADGSSPVGVVLRPDAVRVLLDLLDSYEHAVPLGP